MNTARKKQNDAENRLYSHGVWEDMGTLYSAISLYKIPRDEMREMLAEGNLDAFEKYILQIEESIFNGLFTAGAIEQNLQLVLCSENLNAMQRQNTEVLRNAPWQEAITGFFNGLGMQHLANEIKTGQQPRPDTVSLSEKKNFYQEVLGDMSEVITQVKNRLLAMQRKTPKDNRVVLLLGRYEKCETEIDRICGIIQLF